MNEYCDASFLLSAYLVRESTEQALQTLAALADPRIPVSSLLLLELENAIRLGAFRMTHGGENGVPTQVAEAALARLEGDFDDGRLVLIDVDLTRVTQRARTISNARSWAGGYRTMDILHVATALTLEIPRFLTFDLLQRELAAAEGLDVTF